MKQALTKSRKKTMIYPVVFFYAIVFLCNISGLALCLDADGHIHVKHLYEGACGYDPDKGCSRAGDMDDFLWISAAPGICIDIEVSLVWYKRRPASKSISDPGLHSATFISPCNPTVREKTGASESAAVPVPEKPCSDRLSLNTIKLII